MASSLEYKKWRLVPADDDDDEEEGKRPAVPSADKQLGDEKLPPGPPKEMESEAVERLINDSFKQAALRSKALTLWRVSLQFSVGVSRDDQAVIYRSPLLLGTAVLL
ncbi:MAG: hypothetical protein GY740_07635 [Gammaproteobacteria bacterium]|nr:hypothetical protein [Gammaproteobacteria bacterium]